MKNVLNIGKMFSLSLVLWIGSLEVSLVASSGSNISYEEAIRMLKDGNRRYLLGVPKHPRQSAARRQSTVLKGQKPIATVLTCSDSRGVVELVFDQGIGDVFVVRVAGNVVREHEAGSIEYGVEHLNTPICIVMGHTHCGAVTAVAEGAEVEGNIRKLVEPIIPAVARARQKYSEMDDYEFIGYAVRENVWQSIEDLIRISPVVSKRILDGRVKVVGAVYELETGKVYWMGEHPEQSKLVGDALSDGMSQHSSEGQHHSTVAIANHNNNHSADEHAASHTVTEVRHTKSTGPRGSHGGVQGKHDHRNDGHHAH